LEKIMRLNVQKWGNSAAMRLPASLLAQMAVSVGDAVEAELSNGQLTLKKAKPQYRLADLLAEMPEDFPRAKRWDELPDAGLECA
jgi:antitoxin component of MazEF toxin-antitoxin module